MIKPITLIVLDGWGHREARLHNAIASANTPTWDALWQQYPHTLISGSGLDVGLPKGQMGNSEVGHLHMGAGRQVAQDLVRVDQAISDGSFANNQTINTALQYAIKNQKQIHLIGLLSPGGVHSHERHLQALIDSAAKQGATKLQLHAILDGRDTPPRSALASLALIEKQFHQLGCGQIASITGRYYAMDRDKRWDRIEKAFDLYTTGQSDFTADTAATALEMAYERDETDEFVLPTKIKGMRRIADDDVIIFFNFRADRMRQLTRAFINEDFNEFERSQGPKLQHVVSFTKYASDLATEIAFPPQSLHNVFGEYIAAKGLKQLRIAETEKYAHVTFFFNGGRESCFENEDRELIPSPKVATYDLQPEMSAPLLTKKLCAAISSGQYAAIICNYANPDMVGHTGDFDATVQAVEVIDHCLNEIIQASLDAGSEVLITADHGNAELMFNEVTNQPHTAHTSNPVPVVYVGRNATAITSKGSLTDIAPTLLYFMGLDKPPEMTGNTLFELV